MVAQLFFTPTSCGAASFIAAHKAGIIGSKLVPNLTDIRTKTVLSGDLKGQDFLKVNPKGNVPTLVLDDATMLNEGAAVLQWIADQNTDSGLAAPYGTSARYLLQAKLNWLASELHASAGPLFSSALTGEMREAAVVKMKSKLQYLADVELAGGKQFLVGDGFTVADSYCYIVLSWLQFLGLSRDDYPVLQAYFDNIASLGFVKEAHAQMADISAAA